MSKPKMIGTVNGRALSVFKMNGLKLTFDATISGLAKVAEANGGKIGDKVEANFGGTRYDWCDSLMVLCDRGNGELWADKDWAAMKTRSQAEVK